MLWLSPSANLDDDNPLEHRSRRQVEDITYGIKFSSCAFTPLASSLTAGLLAIQIPINQGAELLVDARNAQFLFDYVPQF